MCISLHTDILFGLAPCLTLAIVFIEAGLVYPCMCFVLIGNVDCFEFNQTVLSLTTGFITS